jgi:general stress protein 26
MATSKTAQHIAKLLEKIDIAMFTTTGPDGFLVSRPLSTQQARFDGKRVWFFTEADSPKVAEIRKHPKVNVAYASKDRNTYLSVAGTAKVNKDRRKINELWSDALKAFFPEGKDDPNLVLLEIQVRTVEYWDGPGSWVGKLASFVVARVTGKEEVMGENRLVDLSPRTKARLPPSHADAPKGARKAARRSVRKSPAKKGTTTKRVSKKAAAKKSTARKTAARKSVAKTSPAKKATRKTAARRTTRKSATKATTRRAAAKRTRR